MDLCLFVLTGCHPEKQQDGNSKMQPAALWWRLSAAGGREARGASPSHMMSVDLVGSYFFF